MRGALGPPRGFAANPAKVLKVDTSAPPYGYVVPTHHNSAGSSSSSSADGLMRGSGADSRGSGKSNQSLDESTSSMSREDMTELADAFVQQEVEKFRKQHGETMSAEDQMLMRKAFVAGMQHSPPPEKDMSASADLQWEFDQSGSIDGMMSMDDDHHGGGGGGGHGFDGVVQGHAIFNKSPDNKMLSRSMGMGGMGMSMSMSSMHLPATPAGAASAAAGAAGPLGRVGSGVSAAAAAGGGNSSGAGGGAGGPTTGAARRGQPHHHPHHHAADMNMSIEGHSWGASLHSDMLNTENLDEMEMSMSLLNMSLEESHDHHGHHHGHHGGFHS